MRIILAVYCVYQSAFQWHYWVILTYVFLWFLLSRKRVPMTRSCFRQKPNSSIFLDICPIPWQPTSLKSSRYNSISQSLLLEEYTLGLLGDEKYSLSSLFWTLTIPEKMSFIPFGAENSPASSYLSSDIPRRSNLLSLIDLKSWAILDIPRTVLTFHVPITDLYFRLKIIFGLWSCLFDSEFISLSYEFTIV